MKRKSVVKKSFTTQAERRKPARFSELILRLTQALNRIIEWNRQTAQDKYGDPEKAESWACVVEARAALRKTHNND